MARANTTKAASKSTTGSLTLYKASELPEHRPVYPSEIEVVGTYGNSNMLRPIGASTLAIAGEFGGTIKRPIGTSDITVVGSFRNPENRPIVADAFKFSRTENQYGNRPIGVSALAIAREDMVFGPRPVASNDVDEESPVLMGYLD